MLQTDETNVEMFCHNAARLEKTKPSISAQHLIPTVKHGGGGLMIWTCFAATGPGHRSHHELLCTPKYSREEWEVTCLTAKARLKLGHQQDKDPKHSSKSTTECLKKKRIKVFRSSPDLSLIEMLWWDLKRAVHKSVSAHVNESKQRCKEQWAKTPP